MSINWNAGLDWQGGGSGGGDNSPKKVLLFGDSITEDSYRAGHSSSLGVPPGTPITGMIGDGATLTVTTTNNHGLSVGDAVRITGVADAGVNGTYWVREVVSPMVYKVDSAFVGTPKKSSWGVVGSLRLEALKYPFAWWANWLGKGTFEIIGATPSWGSRTSDMVTRMATDDGVLFTPKPDIILFLGGTNDVSNGVPLAQSMANYQAIHDLCRGKGIRLAMATVPPRWASDGEPMALATRDLSNALRNWCIANGIPCVDYWTALVDPANQLYAVEDYLADHVHFSGRGSIVIGKWLAQFFGAYKVGDLIKLPTANDGGGLFPNALFANTRSAAQTGVTGTRPENTTVFVNTANATGVSSVAPGPVGNVWRFIYTSAATGYGVSMRLIPQAAPVSAQDQRIRLVCHIKIYDLTADANLLLNIQVARNGAVNAYALGLPTAHKIKTGETLEFDFESEPIFVRAGTALAFATTGCDVTVTTNSGPGSGTVEISRVGVYVEDGGLPPR